VTEGLQSYGYEHGKIHPEQKEDTVSNSCMTRIRCFCSGEGGEAAVTVSIRKLSANIIIVIPFRREAKLHLLLTFSRYLMLLWAYVLIPSRVWKLRARSWVL